MRGEGVAWGIRTGGMHCDGIQLETLLYTTLIPASFRLLTPICQYEIMKVTTYNPAAMKHEVPNKGDSEKEVEKDQGWRCKACEPCGARAHSQKLVATQ